MTSARRWPTKTRATTPRRSARAPKSLRVVLLQIGLMDLSLSIDNVIAAVGLAPKTPSGDPVMWPIYAGVLIAILALQQIAPHAMNLLKKYPILEPTAFVLIGYVGVLLIGEETYHLITGVPDPPAGLLQVRRHPDHHLDRAVLRSRRRGPPGRQAVREDVGARHARGHAASSASSCGRSRGRWGCTRDEAGAGQRQQQ